MISNKFFIGAGLILLSIIGLRCGAVNETQKAYKTKDFRKTLMLAKQAVQADSTDAEAWMWTAKAYVALDSLDKATASLEKTLQIRPADEGVTADAVGMFLQIGDRYREKADTHQARLNYEKAETLNPQSVDALSRLAEMDEQEGRLEEAQRRYEMLIDLSADPTQYATKTNLLETKIRFAEESFTNGMNAYQNKDYERAESAFSKALEAYPAKTNAAYYLNLSKGIRSYKIATPKARKSGISALAKAAEIDPKATEPHFWAARLWEMENKRGNAINEYEIALKLAPKGPWAKICAEKIRNLKKLENFWNR